MSQVDQGHTNTYIIRETKHNNKEDASLAWSSPVISTLGSWRQVDQEFKATLDSLSEFQASLGYTVGLYFKITAEIPAFGSQRQADR